MACRVSQHRVESLEEIPVKTPVKDGGAIKKQQTSKRAAIALASWSVHVDLWGTRTPPGHSLRGLRVEEEKPLEIFLWNICSLVTPVFPSLIYYQEFSMESQGA